MGTSAFYHRRPIVPAEMAGANINLRLGCGVNLMGYYMYSGGSHKIGKLTTLERATAKGTYDYQAPLKEFGTLGVVMEEAKKCNYFMNDFGKDLAPAIAYLPTSNNDTSNLQWAVRSKDDKGFLFCSNYLYKHSRKSYEDVQFQVRLNDGKLKIPRKPIRVKDGAYFLWPFNMSLDKIQLKYSTTQPICKLHNMSDKMWVFFQDDGIPAEYFFDNDEVEKVTVSNGNVNKEAEGYFVSGLIPGTDCIIEIEKTDGSHIKILTLTEEQSDKVWKVESEGIQYLVLTESGVFVENGEITLFSEENNQEALIYPKITSSKGCTDGIFSSFKLEKEERLPRVDFVDYRPMEKSFWIEAINENGKSIISKTFDTRSLSKVNTATLRCAVSAGNISVSINDEAVSLQENGNYLTADLAKLLINGINTIRIELDGLNQFISEIEILTENRTRIIWNTNNKWETGIRKKVPVTVIGKQGENKLPQFVWKKEDGIAYYEIKLPDDISAGPEELRLSISFTGDCADAFMGNEFIHDYLFDGTQWVIGINRFREKLPGNQFIIRVEAFESANPEIYFEKYIDKTGCDQARVKQVQLNPEYRFNISLK